MALSVREKDGFKYVDEGGGPVLMLLHGLFGALSNWEEVVSHYARHFRVVIPMLPIYEMPIKEAGLVGLREFTERFVAMMSLCFGSDRIPRGATRPSSVERRRDRGVEETAAAPRDRRIGLAGEHRGGAVALDLDAAPREAGADVGEPHVDRAGAPERRDRVGEFRRGVAAVELHPEREDDQRDERERDAQQQPPSHSPFALPTLP